MCSEFKGEYRRIGHTNIGYNIISLAVAYFTKRKRTKTIHSQVRVHHTAILLRHHGTRAGRVILSIGTLPGQPCIDLLVGLNLRSWGDLAAKGFTESSTKFSDKLDALSNDDTICGVAEVSGIDNDWVKWIGTVDVEITFAVWMSVMHMSRILHCNRTCKDAAKHSGH